MTRMIFFPGEGSLVVMDSPIPAEELARAVNNGEWVLPSPMNFLNNVRKPGTTLQAICQGEIVIVTLGRAGRTKPVEAPAAGDPSGISIRQHEVLMALSEGMTTRQIARRMNITERTVNYHIAGIKKAFGSLTRAHSVGKAASLGLWHPRGRGRPKKNNCE
jgi:DNA-binding CsgD family transcriptional regulator